jgi:transglutaminase-like putative cysteine protease
MKRDVSTRITVSVTEPANLVFAIAVCAAYRPAAERLEVTLDGTAVEVVELLDLHGTRLHQVEVGPGSCALDYSATIEGRTAPAGAAPADLIRYLRPSRYAESDELAPTATAEFGGIEAPADLLAAVSSWVGTRLAYVGGSSGPTDGAARTLLARQGVCRDFAHLCVALLRSMNVPARLAAVYAPGLEPMDFHAVAEAWVDGAWRVVDATTLAPRSSMVRIATGRDAADTAFLTVTAGRAELVDMEVMAIVDTLPADDVTELASIG